MGLKNPTGKAKSEKYIYLEDPKLLKRVEDLEAELAREKAKEPVVREVIKEVPSPHNVELMEKYNAALREIGALKATKPRLLQSVASQEPKVEVRTEIKEVQVVRLVYKLDKRILAVTAAVSSLLGMGLGVLVF